ncbi:MAG: glucose 1-dehydrogenase [Deltaproteobacteria bacterium]|nr:glucose 1-dehydrogenase [Deltaproteobacteria bacterium]MBW2447531.1 glucose 1-dehydrogenase [Deltaproteobacteria bacterium]
MAGLVDGKVVLVTGAASGIGQASAALFAAEGAKVMLSDVNEGLGKEVAAHIRSEGGETFFRAADVTDEAQVEALIAETVAAYGRLDAAHNNAGITGAVGALQDVSLEEWQRTLDTNLTSMFLCMKHELRVMQKAGRGAIVNTASGAGVIAAPAFSAYTASKHGLLGLTKTAALENARTGVRVNAILPGSIDTPMLQTFMEMGEESAQLICASQPGGRLGTPQEIAEAAVWLCSDRSGFVSGASLAVDAAAVCR